MEIKEKITEPTNLDNKFSIALKAIDTAQHQIRAGHEINTTTLLEEVKKQTPSVSQS